jgi:hypothetical protein
MSCKCGCGKETPLAKRTRKYLGLVKGQPLSFLYGHRARDSVRPMFDKCSECGNKKGKTPSSLCMSCGHKGPEGGSWKHGLSHTREYQNAMMRKYNAENPERHKERIRKYRQNLSPEKKREFKIARLNKRLKDLETKAGRPLVDNCESCGEHIPRSIDETTGKTRLMYDHDHITGQFRGWLCHPCNAALGLLKDDVGKIISLANYLCKNGRPFRNGCVPLSTLAYPDRIAAMEIWMKSKINVRSQEDVKYNN